MGVAELYLQKHGLLCLWKGRNKGFLFGASTFLLEVLMKIKGMFNTRRSFAGTSTSPPVRENSSRKGALGLWWQPFNRDMGRQIYQSAKEFERRTKLKGNSHGALSHTGLEVLKALIDIVDWKTGRLEPSLQYIANRINRCTKTVVEALKRLRKYGFIDWKRRYEESGERKEFGRPQVRQISNAYRLFLPLLKGKLESFLKRPVKNLPDNLVGVVFTPCPIPDDALSYERTKMDLHLEYMRQIKAQEMQEAGQSRKVSRPLFEEAQFHNKPPSRIHSKEEQLVILQAMAERDLKDL